MDDDGGKVGEELPQAYESRITHMGTTVQPLA